MSESHAHVFVQAAEPEARERVLTSEWWEVVEIKIGVWEHGNGETERKDIVSNPPNLHNPAYAKVYTCIYALAFPGMCLCISSIQHQLPKLSSVCHIFTPHANK